MAPRPIRGRPFQVKDPRYRLRGARRVTVVAAAFALTLCGTLVRADDGPWRVIVLKLPA
jgi:hypothetical protein